MMKRKDIPTLQLATEIQTLIGQNMTCILDLCKEIQSIILIEKKKIPYHINVIESAARGRLKETGHSKILADMLLYQPFCNKFIKDFLGITLNDAEVFIEKDNIDVSIKSKQAFIIIENKINNAPEQRSQIYRYVNDIANKKYDYSYSNIYVLYLYSNTHEYPSDFTLSSSGINILDIIPSQNFKVIDYRHDIYNWLKEIEFPTNQPHILSAFDQYIDYLEQKYSLSKDFNDMNNKIYSHLQNLLSLDESEPLKSIDIINNQLEDLAELEDKLEDMKHLYEMRFIESVFTHIKDITGVEFLKEDDFYYFPLRYNIRLGIHSTEDEYGMYIGFAQSNYEENHPIYVKNIIRKGCPTLEESFNYSVKGWEAWLSGCNNFEEILLSLLKATM